MKTMKLSDIKIKESFAATTPKRKKMKECREYFEQNHAQDRYIVVDNTNTLIDGYIQYLVLKEKGVDEAEIKVSDSRKFYWNRKDASRYWNEETTYIYGIHKNNINVKHEKEYVWRVPKSWDWFKESIEVGDHIICRTKYGNRPIIVTRIVTLDKSPVDYPVRKVCKNMIWRVGEC